MTSFFGTMGEEMLSLSTPSSPSPIRLNACLAFVSVHVDHILGEFMTENYRTSSLDGTFVEK